MSIQSSKCWGCHKICGENFEKNADKAAFSFHTKTVSQILSGIAIGFSLLSLRTPIIVDYSRTLQKCFINSPISIFHMMAFLRKWMVLRKWIENFLFCQKEWAEQRVFISNYFLKCLFWKPKLAADNLLP